jgi:TRAP-type transport system small permease protein
MFGMVLLALLAAQSAWRACFAQPEPANDAEPHVPVAHW